MPKVNASLNPIDKGVMTGYNMEGKTGGMIVDKANLTERIANLTAQINALPKGYLSKKAIGNQVYFYHQWSENGSKKSRYLKDDELAEVSAQIELRKELQEELKSVKAEFAGLSKKQNLDMPHTACVLMHKKVPVAELWLDDTTGFIQKIEKVYAPEHFPIGIPVKKNTVDRKKLNDWWTERSIPASRSGVREALETLEMTDTKSLLVRCYGLSLSDQYWICPKGSNLTWDAINFFDNEFSEDIGDILFGSTKKSNAINFSSPDSTSDGNLKKRWKIIDGVRCLVKGGSNPYRQQPLNEAIATEIMKRLNIPCVPYWLTWNKGAPYSVCADFVDENTELVTAWRIIQTKKQPNNLSVYQHFVNCAEALEIPDVVTFLDRMIVLDYLIVNEDRHLNNFGALRNAETLEWLGMAPIYDSGSSLGYDKTIPLMKDRDEITCKPFKKHHDEQLKLVSSFDWIDFSALSDIREIITAVLSDEQAADYMDEKRIHTICDLAEQRVRNLEALAKAGNQQSITTEDDVIENIAADYKA